MPVTRGRYALAEGGRWVEGRYVFVDIPTGRLFELPAGGAERELTRLDVPLGAVIPVAGQPDRWLAAAGRGLWWVSPGAATPIADLVDPGVRMNDGCADPAGRAWVTCMAQDEQPGGGALFRVEPDLTVTRVLEGMGIVNGPAFGPGGRTLYVADSTAGRIDAYDVDQRTGELSDGRPFTTVGSGAPDGLTVDAEGGLWAAVYGAGVVHRYLPDGRLDRVVDLPATQPTSPCLGGPDLDVLHVTTAAQGLDPVPDGAGAVYAVPVGVRGMPVAQFRPDGSSRTGS